jgi:hypothetical protein
MSDSFEQWVENLSQAPRQLAPEHPVMILQSSSSNSCPVCVNVKVVGSQTTQAFEADKLYENCRNGGNSSAALKQLALSPATGCAMVMNLAQQASGFNPATPAQSGSLSGFLNYIQQLINCPVMETKLSDQVNIQLQSNWSNNVSAIMSYYQGISPDQLASIESGLWTVARAAASNANTNETDNLFVQSALNIDGTIKVYIYKSYVCMREDRHTGSGKNAPTITTNQASLKLYRTILKFDSSRWPEYAHIIMPKTNASLSSWLSDNSTPSGTVPVNWNC